MRDRLTRKERSRSKSPLRSPLRQVNAGDDKAWEPPAKQTSSALETADLVLAYVFVLDVALRFAASPRFFAAASFFAFACAATVARAFEAGVVSSAMPRIAASLRLD